MAIKVIDISDEIHRELGQPDDLSVAAINFWIRANFGRLNSLISTDFILVGNEFSPEIGDSEKAILKQIYLVHYYDNLVRRQLGAAGLETVVEVQSDGASVRRVNKTEIGKTYLQAKNAETQNLANLVTAYKSNACTPRQVAGDDTVEGFYAPDREKPRTGI
jgi:hypothetical protein